MPTDNKKEIKKVQTIATKSQKQKPAKCFQIFYPKQKLYIDLGVELEDFDILRRKEEDTEVPLE